MKVIMVEPLKPAYVAEIGTDLESMQKAVGGDIETVYSSARIIKVGNFAHL